MPKKNVYVSEELDELIRSHEGPVPLSEIMRVAIEQYLGAKACPTCGQTVQLKKIKLSKNSVAVKSFTANEVAHPYTEREMREMDWRELRAYAREIDDGTIDMETRKRGVLIDSIMASTGQAA